MEEKSAQILNDNKETYAMKEVAESPSVQTWKAKPISQPGSFDKTSEIYTGNLKGGYNASGGTTQANEGPYGDFNMEVSMSADDVIRAGGFGARDDIGSCFPVASDSTDFEASLLNARGYEDPQKEIDRPGLGYPK